MRSLQFAVGLFLGFISCGYAEDELDDIATVGQEYGEFTTLFSVVDDLGLSDALNIPGPITFFGPTDSAFADPNVDTSAFFADPLTSLFVHVVDGFYPTDQLTDGLELTNFAFGTLHICVTPSGVRKVNGVPITDPDIFGSNGVIQGLGGIIDPNFMPDGTCEDVMSVTPAPIPAPPTTPAPVVGAATCEETRCNRHPDTDLLLQFTDCDVVDGQPVCSCEFSEEFGDEWPICFGAGQNCANPVFDCTQNLCFNWCEDTATDFCDTPPCCEASGCPLLICNEEHRVNGPDSRCTCPEGFEYYGIEFPNDQFTTAAGCRATSETMAPVESSAPAPTDMESSAPAPTDTTPAPVDMGSTAPAPIDMVDPSPTESPVDAPSADDSAAPSGAPDTTPMPVDATTDPPATDPPTGSAGMMHAPTFLGSVLFTIVLGTSSFW